MIHIERNILIIQLSAAGDVVRTTSLLPKIKKKYPNHNIYYLTKDSYAPLLENNPYIYKILPMPINLYKKKIAYKFISCKENIKDIKSFFDKFPEFELAINFHNTYISALIVKLLKIKKCLGWQLNGIKIDLNFDILKHMDKIANNIIENDKPIEKLYLKYFQDEDVDLKNEFYFTDQETENFFIKCKKLTIDFNKKPIVIQLGAGAKNKILDIDQIGKVLVEIQNQKKNQLIFVGSKSEFFLSKKLIDKYKIESLNLCGAFYIREVNLLLKYIYCLISSDTMLIHSTSAFSTKTVIIYYAVLTYVLNKNVLMIKTDKNEDISKKILNFL